MPRRFFSRRSSGVSPVPIYFYHQVDAAELGRICERIAEAKLPTRTADDLLEHRSPDGVALTFDDGWSSVWSIAFPLARRFGLRFTLFLNPWETIDSDDRRPGLDDGTAPADLHARDFGAERFVTWGEARAMVESGVVEIQSHSYHHGVVFTSNEVIGFQSPPGPLPFAGHAPLSVQVGDEEVPCLRPAPGTPVFRTGPALASPHRFLDDPEQRTSMVEWVRARGGAAFFDEPRAQAILRRELGTPRGRWETGAERADRLRRDLSRAREELETRLGIRVQAFAPPWAACDEELARAAADTDHRFLVLGYPFPANLASGSLAVAPRLFGDAIPVRIDGPLRGTIGWVRARRAAIDRVRAGGIP